MDNFVAIGNTILKTSVALYVLKTSFSLFAYGILIKNLISSYVNYKELCINYTYAKRNFT